MFFFWPSYKNQHNLTHDSSWWTAVLVTFWLTLSHPFATCFLFPLNQGSPAPGPRPVPVHGPLCTGPQTLKKKKKCYPPFYFVFLKKVLFWKTTGFSSPHPHVLGHTCKVADFQIKSPKLKANKSQKTCCLQTKPRVFLQIWIYCSDWIFTNKAALHNKRPLILDWFDIPHGFNNKVTDSLL